MSIILTKHCVLNCCTYICVKPPLFLSSYYPGQNTRHKYKQMKAGVFIYDPERNVVLLVQSRYDKWGSPKGTKEATDETVESCAIREVLEETGIQLKMDEILSAKKYVIDRSTYFYLEKSSIQYPCDIIVNDVDNDATGIGWIHPDCIMHAYIMGKMDLNSHCKKLLLRFLQLNLYNVKKP